MSYVNRNTAQSTSALTTTGTASSRGGSTVVAFATCLILLVASNLPAFADHIHHLWYNNASWQDIDLMNSTGNRGVAVSFGAIAAIHTTPNQQLHVYYVDGNSNHVHQLYYNGTTWSDEDITWFGGGISANPFGLSAFAIGNFQYVFYVGSDSHVHMLNYNNSKWSDLDITTSAGGTLASANHLVAFATSPNNQFHVYYQDLNSVDLYQLYFNGSHWTHEDLTSEVGGAYCQTQWIAGYAVGNEQHLFCPGISNLSNNLHMIHIVYVDNWGYEDVTQESLDITPLPLRLGTGVAAFDVPGSSKNAFAFASNSEMNWYANLGVWYCFFPAGPADNQYGGIVAFRTVPNNQFHVYYAPNSEVYQLYNAGFGWNVEDLTGGRGQADPNGGMAGFAIGNLQHVFYMSTNLTAVRS